MYFKNYKNYIFKNNQIKYQLFSNVHSTVSICSKPSNKKFVKKTLLISKYLDDRGDDVERVLIDFGEPT